MESRKLVASAIFGVKRYLRPDTFRALDELMMSQWWPLDRLKDVQVMRLRRIASHAFRETRHYRATFHDAGIDPASITLDGLRKLPILEKSDIQEHGKELRAHSGVAQPARTIKNHTGGSTGEPLTFYQDYEYQYTGWAELLRDYMLCGYRLGDAHAFLWGSDYDSKRHSSIRGHVMEALQNVLWLNAFMATPADLLDFADRLHRFRPKLLIGYVSSLTSLATILKLNGISDVTPAAVQTSAEVLTPAQRSIIEAAFGCRAFDRYGCREVGNLAHECEAHDGLHLLTENNLVEIVREDGSPAAYGEVGYIVATNLRNHAMPFIRYRLGDLGSLSKRECSCGRGLPMMESVVGRSSDVITAPNGRLIHGEFFTHLFYGVPGIRQFRVEQRSSAHLNIQIAVTGEFDRAEIGRLEQLIREYGDEQFVVTVETRDQIPPSASGKFRFTVSNVPLKLD